jgi:hypothetical protein
MRHTDAIGSSHAHRSDQVLEGACHQLRGSLHVIRKPRITIPSNQTRRLPRLHVPHKCNISCMFATAMAMPCLSLSINSNPVILIGRTAISQTPRQSFRGFICSKNHPGVCAYIDVIVCYCVCVYVCMCVSVFVCVCLYFCVYVCVCMCLYKYV